VTIAILYQDDFLVAVDKPAGMLVIPGRGAVEQTVQQELQETFGRIWVVHRLDRGTSGVLVFGRTAEAHRALNIAFEHHQIHKQYLALVRGHFPEVEHIDVPIAPARRGRMRPARPDDPKGKVAATRVRRLALLQLAPEVMGRAGSAGSIDASLVEAVPETGRTHQIRVHLVHAGYPLLFDPDYGAREPLRGASGEVVLERTPLHASRIELPLPRGGSRVIEAPLPPDMEQVLALGRGDAKVV
jgi:tRNA pseudouridine32 synthase/23S rRNA pseudouridine746 synthase